MGRIANEVTITVKGKDQGGKKAVEEARSSLRRVGEAAQGIIAAQLFEKIGQSAQQFLGNARDASSNLGESVNAVQVVFKDAAGGIMEIGKTSATSMGLSQRAFNEAAIRFSAFAEAVAGPGGDVATVIQGITQRATDFASVMNLDVEQAMQVFQSGLAGESEPLRQYGIDVSAAAVQTFAYANGIAAAGEELTEAQKIQARYGLIMQETADTAGDFANTSDSMANQQRILNAEWENAQATMGSALVPAFEALNAVLLPLLQSFQSLPGPVQTVVSVLIVLGAAILTVTSRIAPMIISMNAAGISAGTAATKFRAVALSAASMGVAIAAAGVGIIAWGQSARHVQGDVEGLSDDIRQLQNTGEVTAQLKNMFGEGSAGAEEFKDKLDVATAGFFDWSDSLNRTFDETSKAKSAFEDLDASLASMVAQGADADELMRLLAETFDLNESQVNKLKDALPNYTEEAERAAAAADDQAGATDTATAAIDAQISSLDMLASKLQEQTDPLFAFIAAQRRAEEAQVAVTEAEEEFGRNSPEYEGAVIDAAEANLELFGAMRTAAGGMDGSMIPALRRARDAGIITEEQFDALRDAIREVDRTDARITVTDNAARAETRFRQLQRNLKNIDRFVNYHFTTSGQRPAGALNVPVAHGGIAGGRGMQDGGISGNGMSPLEVNEQGEELARVPTGDLISLATGSTVIPHGQSQAMLDRHGAGGPTEVVVRFEFGGAEEAFVEFIRKVFRHYPDLS